MAAGRGVTQEKEVLQAVRQTTVAWLLGVDRSQLAAWEGVPRNTDGTYPAAEVVAWFLQRIGRARAGEGGEGGGDGGARERAVLASAATREFALAEKAGVVIPRAVVREVLAEMAVVLRRVGEQLRAAAGEEAAGILDRGLDEVQSSIERRLGGKDSVRVTYELTESTA